jgi:hypothetical protein
MEHGNDFLKNSKVFNHLLTNKSGEIVYQNKAFKNTFTHIRPSNVSHLTSNPASILGAMMLSMNKSPNPEIIYTNCKSMDGGVMCMIFEITYVQDVFSFIGFLSLDKQEYDEQMFAMLKQEVRQFKFEVSHNVRAPLANIIGLNDIISQAESMDEVKRLTTMLKKATEQLDQSLLNLIGMIK